MEWISFRSPRMREELKAVDCEGWISCDGDVGVDVCSKLETVKRKCFALAFYTQGISFLFTHDTFQYGVTYE